MIEAKVCPVVQAGGSPEAVVVARRCTDLGERGPHALPVVPQVAQLLCDLGWGGLVVRLWNLELAEDLLEIKLIFGDEEWCLDVLVCDIDRTAAVVVVLQRRLARLVGPSRLWLALRPNKRPTQALSAGVP